MLPSGGCYVRSTGMYLRSPSRSTTCHLSRLVQCDPSAHAPHDPPSSPGRQPKTGRRGWAWTWTAPGRYSRDVSHTKHNGCSSFIVASSQWRHQLLAAPGALRAPRGAAPRRREMGVAGLWPYLERQGALQTLTGTALPGKVRARTNACGHARTRTRARGGAECARAAAACRAHAERGSTVGKPPKFAGVGRRAALPPRRCVAPLARWPPAPVPAVRPFPRTPRAKG